MIDKKINSLLFRLFLNLSKFDEILHFVSTRISGYSSSPYDSLNIGFHVGDDYNYVLKNRELLSEAVRIPLENLTTAKQIHSGNLTIVKENMRGLGSKSHIDALESTDAMITNINNICIMVLLADCVPILFFDPKKKVIGAAHAGWKGTVNFVAENVVKNMINEYGCKSNDILVGIGPSIGPCCYEVGQEVIEHVGKNISDKHNYISNITDDSKAYFDLWNANKSQLLSNGILEKNIELSGICTYCNANLFFSERKQRGKTGRFGTAIMIK